MARKSAIDEVVVQSVAVADMPDSPIEQPTETVTAPPVAALPSEQIAAEIQALEAEIAEIQSDQQHTETSMAKNWHGDNSSLASEFSQRAARLVGGRARLGLLKVQYQEAQKVEALAKYDTAIRDQADLYVQLAALEDEQAALKAQISQIAAQISEFNSQFQIIRGRADKAHKQAIASGASSADLMSLYRSHVGRSRHM